MHQALTSHHSAILIYSAMDLHYVYIGPCLFLWAAIDYQYSAVQQSTQMKVKYNTIQLYCLCVEKFAFWLVIYIKQSIYLTIKHQRLNETRK